MITEDYVSFEVAKLLKEKEFGIEEETRGYYPIKGDALGRLMFGAEYHHNTSQVQISAPTHQMAMKWLRENGIIIEILHVTSKSVNDGWFYSYQKNNDSETNLIEYPSYEEAVEAAIKYCLENLI